MRRALVLAIACGSACSQIFGLDTPTISSGDAGTCAFRSVSAGRAATCAVDGSGAVWCWGDNGGGKVQPDGDQSQPVVVPTRIALARPAVQVTIGNIFACARLDDGTLWCWGQNDQGALGNGNTQPQTTPVQVQLGNDTAIDVDAGAYHACARLASNSAIACWGDNSQLDLAEPAGTTTQPVPVAIPGTEGSLALGVGHRHACAIDATQHVQCWGRNRDGQLGTTLGSASAVLETVPNLGPVTQVAASGRESCAVEQLGDARCWGANESGELGNGTFTSSSIPGGAAVANAAEIHAGAFGACARVNDGTVQCWGSLDAGDGQLDISANPRRANVTGATSLSVKFNHTCVTAADQVLCWGWNESGELGRGVRSITPSPVKVALPTTMPVTAASAGAERACAVAGGRMYCWGIAGLGDGTANGQVAPVESAPVALGTSVTGVNLGPYSNGCAIATGGAVYCWGNNGFGQIGTGTTSIYEASPVQVSGLANIVQVAQSDQFTCGVQSGGTILCWGLNSSGQLGNNSTQMSASPVPVAGIGNGLKVVVGYAHACALVGTVVRCWGNNFHGQLGDGTNNGRLAPVNVSFPGSPAISDIAAGQNYTCAVTSLGVVWCWGEGMFGELGGGDYADHNLPVHVSLSGAAKAIAAGGHTTCVFMADGSQYCWGSNYLGQYGNGTTTDSSTPVLTPAIGGPPSLSFGGGCAVVGTELHCWGSNRLIGADPVGISMPMPVDLGCR